LEEQVNFKKFSACF